MPGIGVVATLDLGALDLGVLLAYVLRIDNDLRVKNVQRIRPGVISPLSANKFYPPREIETEGLGDQIEIIGRVVASMHEW